MNYTKQELWRMLQERLSPHYGITERRIYRDAFYAGIDYYLQCRGHLTEWEISKLYFQTELEKGARHHGIIRLKSAAFDEGMTAARIMNHDDTEPPKPKNNVVKLFKN